MNRSFRWIAATAAVLCATCAWAVDPVAGAADESATWPRWQGRLTLGGTAAPLRLGNVARQAREQPASVSLMGDYYLTRSGWGFTEDGGFRATSGLVLGHGPRTLLSLSAAPSRQTTSLRAERRYELSDAWPGGVARDAAASAYLGVGYTGFSRSGWGFSADVGLLSHGGAGRLGGPANGQGLDETLRALRLAPLVQLGVSYAF